MYIDLNVCKQMTKVKLVLLYHNIRNHLTMCKKWAQARLKMLSTKFVYKSYIQYVCITRIWHEISYNGWYAIKPN